MIELPHALAEWYRPARDKEIRSWSFGEVKVPSAPANSHWQRQRHTLADQAIFGPLKDSECACGKYHKSEYRGMICDICGVKVTTPDVRRERFGHIELSESTEHPLARMPSVLTTLPVLPVAWRESAHGQVVNRYYDQVISQEPNSTVEAVVHELFSSLLPAALLAVAWNLPEVDVFARALALVRHRDGGE